MSISNVMDVAEALKLDADSLFTRKAYIGLTSNDEEFLYAAQEYIVQYSDDLTDAFYDYLVQFEPVSDDFRDHNLVSFLKDSHKRYIVRLLSGVYDFDYAIDRLSFGLMYQQLCITPEWYVGAFSFYINAFSEVLALKLAHNPKKLSGTLKALNKVVLLDISLAFDAYEFAHSREVVVARDEVESLYLEQTKQIEHLAFYDALTGLPNRNLLQEKVEQLLTIVRRERRMAALIYIDVINLKEVNDTLGHSVGDKLIREIGQRLYTLVEGIESDEQILLAEALSIARITGDEFCIACLVKDEKTPIEIIKAVDENFAQPFYINEFDINVRNRYGVVFSPNDGDSFDKLLRHADIALNQAKNKSSHIFFYDSSLGAKLCARAYQAKRLESALVKNKRLELRFQPQVDLSTGKLSGAEVLLRWYDEELGWVSPTVFIPLAEV
jgi:diguanylate cyclase (GGDEF)-like protein